MPLSAKEFDEIVKTVQKNKKVTASSILELLKGYVLDTPLQHAYDRKSIKDCITKIKPNKEDPPSITRQNEIKKGYKIRTDSESRVSDEHAKKIPGIKPK